MDEKEADNTDIVTRYFKDLKKHYSYQSKTLKYNAFMDKRYPCELLNVGQSGTWKINKISLIN